MYKFNEIKRVHLEISTLCQAKCPMCARNHHGGLENPNLIKNNLSLEFFKNTLTPDFLKQLESMSFCGNFGDPILNKDLLDMIKYTAEHNPDIDMQLHTNASAKTARWWTELAESLPKNHTVLFGIDGLEDTHHLYRIGTDYNMIMRNAKAFIAAGGRARWNFITFKHNEHQLEQARALSEQMGFESFQEKQTSRFIGSKSFDVLDKNGDVEYNLEPPTEQKIVFIDRKTVENYREVFKTATISCEVEDQKSIYIDAQGHAWPCCFLASVPYQYSTPSRLVWSFMQESTETLNRALDAFGGMDGIDLNKHSMQSIVDSITWQTMWNKSFEDKSILMCTRVCGKFPDPVISQCRDQFLDLVNFS